LFVTNAHAAVEGAKWPVQPVPIGLWQGVPLDFEPKPESRSRQRNGAGSQSAKTEGKGFWKRLFSR
jgi:hypothetical protein